MRHFFFASFRNQRTGIPLNTFHLLKFFFRDSSYSKPKTQPACSLVQLKNKQTKQNKNYFQLCLFLLSRIMRMDLLLGRCSQRTQTCLSKIAFKTESKSYSSNVHENKRQLSFFSSWRRILLLFILFNRVFYNQTKQKQIRFWCFVLYSACGVPRMDCVAWSMFIKKPNLFEWDCFQTKAKKQFKCSWAWA